MTRAVYLNLLPDFSIEEFIRSFKRPVARRGKPRKVYSDNAKTFVAAAKWVKNVMKDEKLQHWLARNDIKWEFNLSRAPCWGGQFERMVGLVKQAFHKKVGNGNLKWSELEEIIIDIETTINSRALCYVEDDIEFPFLIPNVMLFGKPNVIPQQDPSAIEDQLAFTRLSCRLKRSVSFPKGQMSREWSRVNGQLRHLDASIAFYLFVCVSLPWFATE